MYFGQNPNRRLNTNSRQANAAGAAEPFFRQNNRLGGDVIRQNMLEHQNNRQSRQNQQNSRQGQPTAQQQARPQYQQAQPLIRPQQAQPLTRQAQQPQQAQPAKQPYTDPSVMWEPLNENTFAELTKSMAAGMSAAPAQPTFGSAAPPQISPVSPPSQPNFSAGVQPNFGAAPQSSFGAAALPVFAAPSTEKLKSVIQNEKNAAAYYAKFAERHGSQPFAASLKGHSEGNLQKLQELHRIRAGAEAPTREIEIDAPDSYLAALRTAVGEENKALAELSELCEGEFADNSRVTALLLRKLCLVSSMVNEILGLTNKF